MTRILGLDPSATQTGVAFYDTAEPERLIKLRSFSAIGKTAELQCMDFGVKFSAIMDELTPDFVIHETAMRYIAGYKKRGAPDLGGDKAGFWTPNSDQMILPEIQGHIRQACIDRGTPCEGVAVKTWRAELYGRGGGNLARDAAKQAAKNYCHRVGLMPRNDNEAEAGCIAIWAHRCCTALKFHVLGLDNIPPGTRVEGRK
jgi:hypothetical protein